MEKGLYVCSNCGSSDVNVRVWINPNALAVNTDDALEGVKFDASNCWCKDCEQHYVVEEVECD